MTLQSDRQYSQTPQSHQTLILPISSKFPRFKMPLNTQLTFQSDLKKKEKDTIFFRLPSYVNQSCLIRMYGLIGTES